MKMNVSLNELIYENESLTSDFCDKLINLFKIQDISFKFKKYKECVIFLKNKNETTTFLTNEINKHVNKYIFETYNKINILNETIVQKISVDMVFIINNSVNVKNNLYNLDQKKYFLNIIWALNEDENNELEFFKLLKIKPKKGNIYIFPCDWFFPYSVKCSENDYFMYCRVYVDL